MHNRRLFCPCICLIFKCRRSQGFLYDCRATGSERALRVLSNAPMSGFGDEVKNAHLRHGSELRFHFSGPRDGLDFSYRRIVAEERAGGGQILSLAGRRSRFTRLWRARQ